MLMVRKNVIVGISVANLRIPMIYEVCLQDNEEEDIVERNKQETSNWLKIIIGMVMVYNIHKVVTDIVLNGNSA